MKTFLTVHDLHQKISDKGFFDEMHRLGTRKETRSAVGLFWHEKKKKYPAKKYRQ